MITDKMRIINLIASNEMKGMALIMGILCLFSFAYAQPNSDSTPESLKMEQIYDSFVGENRLIFNGKVYRYNYPQADGNQYLVSKEMTPGSITFDGITYDNIQLNYDIYNDLVFFRWLDNTNSRFVIFNEDKITKFSFRGFNFIMLKKGEYSDLESGIYEEAYKSSEFHFLIKNQKKLSKQTRSATTNKWNYFTQKNIYYLIGKNHQVAEIKNKKTVLAAFENDPSIIDFVKKEKLKFSIRRGTFINNVVRVLEYGKK